MWKLLTEYLQNLQDHVYKCEGTDQGRDGYLAWVSSWKRYYRELSQHIREVKWVICRRQSQDLVAHDDVENTPMADSPVWKLQSYREELRSSANAALLLRKDLKEESWQRKLEQQKLQKVS